MNRLRTFFVLLFPYRTHLENEIEYLKAQLAQERRRADVAHEALIEIKRPVAAVRVPLPTAGQMIKRTPKGWDATRSVERNTEERPDAGREDAPESVGAES